jgi:hypothetical protein
MSLSGGITSTSKNRKIIDVPNSKNFTIDEEEESDPADPDLSSSDIEIEIKPHRKTAHQRNQSDDSYAT